jgi:hypothetical protein
LSVDLFAGDRDLDMLLAGAGVADRNPHIQLAFLLLRLAFDGLHVYGS